MKLSILPAIAAAAWLVAGCDTGVSMESETSASCQEAVDHDDLAWLAEKVFTPSCSSFSSCHKGNRAAEKLDLTEPKLCESLVDKLSAQQPSMKLVDPGNPAGSYLLIKLGGGDQSLLSEQLMPYKSPHLCAQKVASVERWIQAGASCGGSPDGGLPDAATPNAPTIDAAMPDAPTIDAAMPDAPTIDAPVADAA